MRNDPIFRHVGPRAVTERLLRRMPAEGGPKPREGNGEAVDGQGDVTKSEVVVWGCVSEANAVSRYLREHSLSARTALAFDGPKARRRT